MTVPIFPQKTLKNVPTVTPKLTNPMIVLAAEMGASAAVREMCMPIFLFWCLLLCW